MKLVEFAGCACPSGLAPVLAQLQKDTGCSFASIYRGADAAHILNKLGKHTQKQLYDATPAQRSAWGVLGAPDRPGTSTHECFSDGVAYRGPAGRRIAWWQCGLDVDDAHVQKVVQAAPRHKWVAFRPYGAGVEWHHINFAKLPKLVNPFLPLVMNKSRGKAVWVYIMRARLRTLGWRMDGGKGNLLPKGHKFDLATERIVKRFQKEHHLKADGIVGPATWAVLKNMAAVHKRKAKK